MVVLWCIIRAVKGRNARICCGCRSLIIFRCYLLLVLFIVGVNLLWSVVWLAYGYIEESIWVVNYTALFILNIMELVTSENLIKELDNRVRPIPPPVTTAVAAPVEEPISVAEALTIQNP